MAYLNKSNIIHNEQEYQIFLHEHDIKDEFRKYGSISNMIEPPNHYPCILVWYEDDSYSSTYWGEFVYLDDFNEENNEKE